MTTSALWPSARAAALPALLAALASGASCGTSGSTCDCADPAVTIDIPADVASSVTSVTVTGTACSGLVPTKTNQTNGGTAYAFTPNAGGSCQISVEYASASTFIDNLTVNPQTGCCAGFYVSPLSAAQVDVPEPGDAG